MIGLRILKLYDIRTIIHLHQGHDSRHYTLNNSYSQPYVGIDDTIKSTFLIRQEISVFPMKKKEREKTRSLGFRKCKKFV